MELQKIMAQLQSGVSLPVIILLVLLGISEVLGTIDSVKASSIYQVLKAILTTVKEQVLPKKEPVAGQP